MEKTSKRIILSVFVLFIFISYLNATSVCEILRSPGSHIGHSKTVEGIVENWVESPSGTSYYILKGDFGCVIKVNSSTRPEVGKRYSVTGLVQKDASSNKPLIAETGRRIAEPERRIDDKSQQSQTQTHTKVDYSWLYILLGILVIALIGLIIWQSQKKSGYTDRKGLSGQEQTGPIGPKTIPSSSEFKTITYTPDPKTMKFIPAKLEIVSHEDKGKSFPLYGRSTEKGTIITIGRESTSGHKNDISINKKFQTVSRQQAEIRAKGDKLFIKNLSETNPTKVNGKKLSPGEMPELKIGDNIRMGELEFEYKGVK